MRRIGTFAAAMCLGLAAIASAQDKSVLEAFDHYELVRVALSTDTLPDVAMHAKMLAPLADKVGGARAKASAEQLIKAKSLDDARKHFGELSTALVPTFQAANIAGAHAFICTMKNKPWMQKGDTIANPYFGKAMPGCGSPLEAKRK
ncbi:MAG: hypothetical protein K2Y23_24860 [Cyanobacteria bacterium]|nr:hypothetical protein [Cyanobacteriota bacterium]